MTGATLRLAVSAEQFVPFQVGPLLGFSELGEGPHVQQATVSVCSPYFSFFLVSVDKRSLRGV